MGDQYDSDEDVSDLEFTTTATLLGYAETTPPDDTTSHLGGTPTWFDEPMDSRMAKCLSCNNLMPLLLQLDGNLADSPHHTRMLYIFGCRAKACRKKPGSIRAIRGLKATGVPRPDSKPAAARPEPPKEQEPAPKGTMGNLIFGGSSSSSAPTNPFATSQTNPFATKPNPFAKDPIPGLTKSFAEAASISTPSPAPKSEPTPPTPSLVGPPSPWPETSEIPQYPHFYLDASYEELEPDTLTLQAQKLAQTIKMETSDGMDEDTGSSKKASAKASSSRKESKEKEFESAMNAAFLHFQSIASQNPEQVLRYERKGIPLLYSREDAIGKLVTNLKGSGGQADVSLSKVPQCGNCGRGRCFELQLMPHTISVLESSSEGALDEDGSEKGKYVEEWVGVQWETD